MIMNDERNMIMNDERKAVALERIADSLEKLVFFKTNKNKPEGNWFCIKCNKGITQRVSEYSNDVFGMSLCFVCQSKAKSLKV